MPGTLRTSSITFNAIAGTTYKIAVDGYNNGGAGGDIGSVTLNWNLANCAASFVQLSQSGYVVNESAGFVAITINRSGNIAGPASVNYATSDSAGLVSCGVTNTLASERCDYATTVGTARFAALESSKTVNIPIVDDALVEGNETFSFALSAPTGVTMGANTSAIIGITENDSAPSSQNPIDGIPLFVTQQYIDFLGRLPDATGFANWVATLNGCPNGGFGEFDNPGCDRVHVSAGFFQSTEFQGRGYFAYRFYEVALDRRPNYAEFVPDMAIVGGPQSPESEVLSKQSYTDAWLQRPEFKARYDALANSAYVNAL
ncbi:MAG TPA: Calx-beta domain-containing protein, partial [Pyrinomonadaceae bacterium]|nr:Calx-beta domain-containing protein [Pyrinomonadaceae bacterium]